MIHLPGSKCDGEFLNTLSDVEDKPVVIRNLSVPRLDVISDGIGQYLKKKPKEHQQPFNHLMF